MARSRKRKLGGDERGAPPEAAPPPSPAPIAASRAGRRARAVLVLMAVAPWALVAWMAARPPRSPRGATAAHHAANGGAEWQVGRRGPWGLLERLEIAIEPPAGDVTPDLCEERPAKWSFPDQSRDQVLGLLDGARLDDSQREVLGARLRCNEATGRGCEIDPPVGVILKLSPEARSTIYGALARYDENDWYQYGFRRRSEDPATWFAEPRLSRHAAGVLGSLVWHHGKVHVFSDLGAACSQLTPPEKAAAVRAIARTPALLVRLRVEPTADLDELTDYWGLDVYRKGVRPLLEALRAAGGDSTLDIAHLLPPLVRERLYTYPSPGDPPRDCHWTSANFYLPQADDRYRDLRQVRALLAGEFREVPLTERRLGDILVYYRNERVEIHSAVYIADDIVFTKNGEKFLDPWVLMSLEDVGNLYAPDDRYRIRAYRKR